MQTYLFPFFLSINQNVVNPNGWRSLVKRKKKCLKFTVMKIMRMQQTSQIICVHNGAFDASIECHKCIFVIKSKHKFNWFLPLWAGLNWYITSLISSTVSSTFFKTTCYKLMVGRLMMTNVSTYFSAAHTRFWKTLWSQLVTNDRCRYCC